MAVSLNFTHNILDLLTIRNATMPVEILFHADLQVERIICCGTEQPFEGKKDFQHKFLVKKKKNHNWNVILKSDFTA